MRRLQKIAWPETLKWARFTIWQKIQWFRGLTNALPKPKYFPCDQNSTQILTVSNWNEAYSEILWKVHDHVLQGSEFKLPVNTSKAWTAYLLKSQSCTETCTLKKYTEISNEVRFRRLLLAWANLNTCDEVLDLYKKCRMSGNPMFEVEKSQLLRLSFITFKLFVLTRL